MVNNIFIKKIVFVLVGLLLAISFGWYFQNDAVKLYHYVAQGISGLQIIDVQKTKKTIEGFISTPSSLKIWSPENSIVLTKEKVITQTNIARYENGALSPLAENSLLNEVAQKKAQDMFDKQYFEHVSPSGVGPGDLAKSVGYDYIIEGENLILGNFENEKEVVNLWMQSPDHRANILHAQYVDIGVAMVKGTYDGKTVWIGVQEFGIPSSLCPSLEKGLKEQIETGGLTMKKMEDSLDVKKALLDKTNPEEDLVTYNQLVGEYNQLAEEYNAFNQSFKPILNRYNTQAKAMDDCIRKNQ